MANELYDKCLEKISKQDLQKFFHDSFGAEYSKVIDKMFDDSIPNVLPNNSEMNDKLRMEQQSLRQMRTDLMNFKTALKHSGFQ